MSTPCVPSSPAVAQARNQQVNAAIEGFDRTATSGIQQLLAAEDPARTFNKHPQQAKFGIGQRHHQPVGGQGGTAELGIDHEGGAVQLLRRAENGAGETMGDHDVVADGEAVHGRSLVTETKVNTQAAA